MLRFYKMENKYYAWKDGEEQMEVLANTEYQDVYRIVDGVLLIVNKFKRIIYDEDKYFKVFSSKAKLKSYNKGCQKWLKVLKEDYYDTYSNITVPKGTVLYQNYPIELSNVYKYEVKTTGTSFSGNYAAVKNIINDIREVMDVNEFKDVTCYINTKEDK